jgi:hypothetical protein
MVGKGIGVEVGAGCAVSVGWTVAVVVGGGWIVLVAAGRVGVAGADGEVQAINSRMTRTEKRTRYTIFVQSICCINLSASGTGITAKGKMPDSGSDQGQY